MTAPNHALTGAFIGLAIGNPWIAVPVAFASHFVCDAIPHFDVPGKNREQRIGSRMFLYVQIILGGLLCLAIAATLFALHRGHWLLAIVCALAAIAPDLLSAPRFVNVRRGGTDIVERWWFWNFHNAIQWFQKPIGLVVEIVWAAAMLMLIRVVI